MTIAPPAPPYLGPAKFQGTKSNKPIKRIVLHGTVGPCRRGAARATAKYFRELVTRPSSAHYVVDPGEVVQVVYDSWVAFHAPPNPGSLGVELCDWVAANNGKGPGAAPMTRWNDAEHSDMLQLAAELVAQLCLAYGVPIRFVGPIGLRLGRKGICEHSDVTAAWHQTSHWDLGEFPRGRFLRMVKAEAAKLRDLPRAHVNIVMSASRFSRTPASLLAAVKTYLPGNDLVFLTEVGNDKRIGVLRTMVKFLPGIGLVNIEPGAKSENAVLFKKWKWRPRAAAALKVTDQKSSKLGTILPYDLGTAFEHFRTGQVLALLLGHKPAHLEGPTGFRQDPQGKFNTKAWLESVETDSEIVARWLADPLIDHVMVWNDWNLSWRLGWVKKEVASHFPADLRCCWEGHMPVTGGTLPGSRITEYGLGDVEWISAELMKDDPSSDHRPMRARALMRAVHTKVTRKGTIRL
jgi:hypothetical protein